MARKTDYQKQADKRTRDSLRLRARFDARARKAALQLAAALVAAENAKARIDRVNQLYNTDYSTETLLVHDLRVAGVGAQLTTLMGESEPGEELQIYNPTVNLDPGTLLPIEAIFGELVAPAPTPTPTPTPTPGPAYDTTLNGPDASAGGVTLAAQAGDAFSFNVLSTGGAAPSSMDLYRNGQQVASVAYFDRYNGRPFRWVSQLGTFAGVFASGNVSL